MSLNSDDAIRILDDVIGDWLSDVTEDGGVLSEADLDYVEETWNIMQRVYRGYLFRMGERSNESGTPGVVGH